MRALVVRVELIPVFDGAAASAPLPILLEKSLVLFRLPEEAGAPPAAESLVLPLRLVRLCAVNAGPGILQRVLPLAERVAVALPPPIVHLAVAVAVVGLVAALDAAAGTLLVLPDLAAEGVSVQLPSPVVGGAVATGVVSLVAALDTACTLAHASTS
jgi:hypothetical protein